MTLGGSMDAHLVKVGAGVTHLETGKNGLICRTRYQLLPEIMIITVVFLKQTLLKA